MLATPIPSFGGQVPSAARPELHLLLTKLMTWLEPSPIPLAQWALSIEKAYRSKARSTRLRMLQAVREAISLAPAGGMTSDLTPEMVEKFTAASSAAGRRPATTNGLLRALRTACNLAMKAGQIACSPFSSAPPWADEEPRTKHHSRKELARLLDFLQASSGTWEGARLHAFASVLAYTGLRRNEALTLTWDRVDLSRSFLVVKAPEGKRLKTKASKGIVPLPKVLVAILSAWKLQSRSSWVFPGAKHQGPWTGGGLGKRAGDRLKAAGMEIGIEGLTPHSLRHSLATHLTGFWGATGKQRQQILRHATERMGDYYCGEDLDNLRDLVRDFDYSKTARPRKGR